MSKKPLVSVKGTPKLPPRREKVREGGREWGGGRLFGVSSHEDTFPMIRASSL